MEPLTHSLTGYMMSRAGLDRWCPRATPLLLLSANVPDIDYLSLLGGDLAMLEWRRGPTHGLLWMAALAALPLLPFLFFGRKQMRWRRAYVVSILGVLVHILLDWTNIYGVRLLTPITGEYFHLSITGVTDLWMLGVLLVCSSWFLISRLVASEIGAARAGGRGAAVFALLFVFCWQGGRYFCHERALAVMDARLYGGEAPKRIAALPHFGSPFHWTGIVETEAAHRVFELNLLDGRFDPAGGKTYYQAEPSGAIEVAEKTGAFQRFLCFAEYPLWRVMPAEDLDGGFRVEVSDTRFGLPGEGRFVATAVLTAGLQVEKAWFQFDPSGGGPRFR